MKIILNYLLTAVFCLSASPHAHAGWFSRDKKDKTPEIVENYLNTPLSTQEEQQIRADLQSLSTSMTYNLATIESYIRSSKFESALSLAKKTLDSVRIKTGIDPKVKLQQSILVSEAFPTTARSFNNLSNAQQESVILTIKDFRGGLFMDILNLSKRISLLYIKALHASMNKNGGLTIEDRNKIIRDLAKASVILLPVSDKLGTKINVFDEDVANEDHIYLFNREIKMYLLNAKDLAITEEQFEKYKADYRKSLGANSTSKPNDHGEVRITRECVNYVLVTVYGRSFNTDSSGVSQASEICRINNNMDHLKDCVDSYLVQIWGRNYNTVFTSLTDGIAFCKANPNY